MSSPGGHILHNFLAEHVVLLACCEENRELADGRNSERERGRGREQRSTGNGDVVRGGMGGRGGCQ